MKTVYMTQVDYEAYLEGFYELWYDSPQQLYEYEGDVPFVEVNIYSFSEN